MLGHGRPMQTPALGELENVVAGLILADQLLDLSRSEATLDLPLAGPALSNPSPEQGRQLLGQSSQAISSVKVRASSP